MRLPPRRGSSRRFLMRRLLPLVVLVGVAVLAVSWPTVRQYGLTGAAYGARVGCSCRYLGGRGLADCRKDFEPGMALVMLSEDTDARSVTARFPLVATQTAIYREGEGCVLERWED